MYFPSLTRWTSKHAQIKTLVFLNIWKCYLSNNALALIVMSPHPCSHFLTSHSRPLFSFFQKHPGLFPGITVLALALPGWGLCACVWFPCGGPRPLSSWERYMMVTTSTVQLAHTVYQHVSRGLDNFLPPHTNLILPFCFVFNLH